VQQTTVVAVLDSPAVTLSEALLVPRTVFQDTPVMETIVQVSQINGIFNIFVCLHHDSSFVDGCDVL